MGVVSGALLAQLQVCMLDDKRLNGVNDAGLIMSQGMASSRCSRRSARRRPGSGTQCQALRPGAGCSLQTRGRTWQRLLWLPTIQWNQRLHCAFAKGLTADNDAAAIILNGPSKNFRC